MLTQSAILNAEDLVGHRLVGFRRLYNAAALHPSLQGGASFFTKLANNFTRMIGRGKNKGEPTRSEGEAITAEDEMKLIIENMKAAKDESPEKQIAAAMEYMKKTRRWQRKSRKRPWQQIYELLLEIIAHKDLEKTLKEGVEENEQLNTQIQQITSNLDATKSQNADLETRKQTLEGELQKTTETLAATEAELEEAKTRIQRLTDELQTKTDEHDTIDKSYKALESNVVNLNEVVEVDKLMKSAFEHAESIPVLLEAVTTLAKALKAVLEKLEKGKVSDTAGDSVGGDAAQTESIEVSDTDSEGSAQTN